jgi:exopolyphosphatase / guanosine-5'-triphosphate,3'-diphosphate pyrophosphatase
MRLALLDIGSNTVNFLVADSDRGVPRPIHRRKCRSHLAEKLRPDGSLGAEARRHLISAVADANQEARRFDVAAMFAYTTAVVRDAPNCAQVRTEVEAVTGVRLGLLSGVEEAQLTFLAARRWLGWQAGPMLLVDIGGGSLEVAFGRDRLPESARSVPLGAGRLTREFLLANDPPPAKAVRNLRRHVRERFAQIAAGTHWESPRTTVATSKTFQQLARLTGAAPLRRGPFVKRQLERRRLRPWIDRLAAMPIRERGQLPGISAHRAGQILAGAIVADEVMRQLDIDALRVCPWALREGVLLRELERSQPELSDAGWVPWDAGDHYAAAGPQPLTAIGGRRIG